MSFKEISYQEFESLPFKQLDKEWALLTAGVEGDLNTMTVSWGAMGTIWRKPAITAYVRPQRYTKKFVDREDTFTLCFFDEEYREKLAYLGKASGRDEDKIAKSGLTACFCQGENAPIFKEAKLAFVCKKMFAQDFLPENFVDESIIDSCYPDKDFHTMYIASVEKVLVKED